jgi:peptide/nickel transport system permease protein
MLVYSVRRLLQSIPILVASTFVIFLMVASSVDPMTPYLTKKPPLSAAQLDSLRVRFGLTKPLLQRYWDWLSGLVLHGTFGSSTQTNFHIGQQLGYAMEVTLRLVVGTILIALILAVIVGVTTAVRQYSKLDYATTAIGFLFLSLPTFWFAVLLKEWAIQINESTGTHFFDTLWESSPNPPSGFLPQLGDAAQHMILPVVTLALLSYAAWSRFQRASMLEVLGSDYMRLARAKGLSPLRVLFRHGLRNALIPLTTQVALDTAALLSGAVITETIYSWRGMGLFFITSIEMADPDSVMAWLLVTAVFVVVMNLIADLLYAVLDPRIRLA